MTKEPSTLLQNGKKRERKVYALPGQKRDPPEERDPLRIFYGTLYEQVPDSEMAQLWMMESGLLAKEVAQKIFERKQKKNPRVCSPMRATPASKKTQSTSTKKKMSKSPPPSTKTKKLVLFLLVLCYIFVMVHIYRDNINDIIEIVELKFNIKIRSM